MTETGNSSRSTKGQRHRKFFVIAMLCRRLRGQGDWRRPWCFKKLDWLSWLCFGRYGGKAWCQNSQEFSNRLEVWTCPRELDGGLHRVGPHFCVRFELNRFPHTFDRTWMIQTNKFWCQDRHGQTSDVAWALWRDQSWGLVGGHHCMTVSRSFTRQLWHANMTSKC